MSLNTTHLLGPQMQEGLGNVASFWAETSKQKISKLSVNSSITSKEYWPQCCYVLS